jgi:hypothetical protein
MNTHICPLVLALVAMLSTAQAETPAQIAADYRAKAEQATERLNKTLDTEAAKISATLLSLGDAPAVEKLAEQVKAKQAGEAVAQPVSQAAQLFASYDAARIKALAPVRESTLRRIEATLSSSEGQKTEIVAELAKLKTDVEAGKRPPETPIIPRRWTYHGKPDSTSKIAEALFNPDGTMEFHDRGTITKGTWKPNQKGDKITIRISKEEWLMCLIESNLATLDLPEVGRRYLKVATSQ